MLLSPRLTDKVCQTAEKHPGFATAVGFDLLEPHLRQNTGHSHPTEASVPGVFSTPPFLTVRHTWLPLKSPARVRIVKLLAVIGLAKYFNNT